MHGKGMRMVLVLAAMLVGGLVRSAYHYSAT
jgi:hypothetical protein